MKISIRSTVDLINDMTLNKPKTYFAIWSELLGQINVFLSEHNVVFHKLLHYLKATVDTLVRPCLELTFRNFTK